ncbi:aldo/keto reductase [uncultured Clostridium sp.]|uniref:aldo/keto reductase family protein n=1 Tax=uncultured Clostridium sp. TaxID=59620 RepID=UPI0028E2E9B7|nr:aldo/keto reductase [uncultured Clostridium sp.]
MSERMKFILGTMTFGSQVNEKEAEKMLNLFLESGHQEIDTAYVYNNGLSEEILGSILKNIPNNSYSIATKVNPRITGRLDAEAINMQISKSLRRLLKESVDILYLHFPNHETPIESTLEVCAELYKEGKFRELGLSNFPAWMVVDVWHICKRNGWPVPTVYQGMYNGLSRKAEDELFLALRKLGIRFYAFNPLAGGILSGKYNNYEEEPISGRFTFRTNYKERYWKKSFFEALNFISSACREENIKIVEAAYRWLAFHSCLDINNGDGILIGASNIEQLMQNILLLESGPLPDKIVASFDAAWQETKSDSPQYFRFLTKKEDSNYDRA